MAIGALMGGALLALYALAMAINLARGRRDLDCGCGIVRKSISASMVVRNLLLAAFIACAAMPASSGCWASRTTQRSLVRSPSARLLYASAELLLGARRRLRRSLAMEIHMSAFMISHVVLWALVIVLSLVVFALARQIGVLHDRIAPTGALMLAKGLTVGEPAPIVAVHDMDGNARQLGAVRDDGKSTLVMFVSPTCPVCKTLLPVLKSSVRAEQSWLDIVLASDGDGGHATRVPAEAGHLAAALRALTAARHRVPDQSIALCRAAR